jgi:hypothetical protein
MKVYNFLTGKGSRRVSKDRQSGNFENGSLLRTEKIRIQEEIADPWIRRYVDPMLRRYDVTSIRLLSSCFTLQFVRVIKRCVCSVKMTQIIDDDSANFVILLAKLVGMKLNSLARKKN